MSFKIKRFLSIFYARNKEFIRDRGAFSWAIIFPIIIIVSFGYIFKLDENYKYQAAVISSDTYKLCESFHCIKLNDKQDAINRLNIYGLDIIIESGAKHLNYWINSKSPKSLMAEKILQAQAYENPNIKLKQNAIEGNNISYIEWLFPGLLSMNAISALSIISGTIVRDRKLGILKRFKASPLSSCEYLSAQVMSRLAVTSMIGIVIFIVGQLIYPFKVMGSYADLFVIYVLNCFAFSSIGVIFATRLSSDELVRGLLNIISFPMMLLSEVWFSLDGSPAWVQNLAKFMPLWHGTNGMRRIMFEGVSLIDLYSSIVSLLAIGLVFLILGSLCFKWTS